MSLVKLQEPDREVIARRDAIVSDLVQLIGDEVVIADIEGRRTFEAAALSGYRSLPLTVVLPRTTEEVSKLLK